MLRRSLTGQVHGLVGHVHCKIHLVDDLIMLGYA